MMSTVKRCIRYFRTSHIDNPKEYFLTLAIFKYPTIMELLISVHCPQLMLMIIVMLILSAKIPLNSALATVKRIHPITISKIRSKGGRSRINLLRGNPHSFTRLSTCHSLQSKPYINSKTSLSSNDVKSEDINFEASGFSFEMDSFDRKGKWMKMDWNNKNIACTPPKASYKISQPDSDVRICCYSPDEPSPVQLSLIRDRIVFVKRDDLLHLHNSNVSGNKARKMMALNELDMEDFPDAIVSYGGPQSNAMLALAAIINSRNVELANMEAVNEGIGIDVGLVSDVEDEIENDSWLHNDNDEVDPGDNIGIDFCDGEDDDMIEFEPNILPLPEGRRKRFIYYTKKLPRYLRKQPNGNLLRALSLGMEIIEISNEKYNQLFRREDGGSTIAPEEIDPPVPMKSLWVPQGGFCGMASLGAKLMADEIVSFWSAKGNQMPLTVCLPGGTCTTALLLCREINALIKEEEDLDIKVSVIPCVGDAAYAERQMKALDHSEGGNGRDNIPEIFMPWKKIYPRFGEPLLPILNTFLEMKDEHGIYVDLLYGAPAWNLLLKYLTSQRESPIKGRQVMYVHSGGLEGVSSQLTRYKHKGLLDSNQIKGL